MGRADEAHARHRLGQLSPVRKPLAIRPWHLTYVGPPVSHLEVLGIRNRSRGPMRSPLDVPATPEPDIPVLMCVMDTPGQAHAVEAAAKFGTIAVVRTTAEATVQ
jgi:hypothetical protein